MVVNVYTDGACTRNPGPGGWGIVILFPNKEAIPYQGFSADTTNNQMELQAAINALKLLYDVEGEIIIHSDSEYLVRGITSWVHKWLRNGWRTANREPVKNKELWEQLYQLAERANVTWEHVQAHSGNCWNELANDLAQGKA